MNIQVAIRAVKDSLIPTYATEGAAGADLKASLPASAVCGPGKTLVVPTGVYLEIPAGVEGQIRPRSGLAFKHGISIVNSPGTIDSDFRGEIKIALINLGEEPFIVNPEDRIAQIVFAPVLKAEFTASDFLGDSKRGEGGFGSTGR